MTDTPQMVIRILTLALHQTRNLALAHLALALTWRGRRLDFGGQQVQGVRKEFRTWL